MSSFIMNQVRLEWLPIFCEMRALSCSVYCQQRTFFATQWPAALHTAYILNHVPGEVSVKDFQMI